MLFLRTTLLLAVWALMGQCYLWMADLPGLYYRQTLFIHFWWILTFMVVSGLIWFLFIQKPTCANMITMTGVGFACFIFIVALPNARDIDITTRIFLGICGTFILGLAQLHHWAIQAKES